MFQNYPEFLKVMAPFKLRFSKSSKSRSKDGNRSQPETPRTEYNQVAVGNNLQSRFPHSPPPSYERVLQEVLYIFVI